MDALHINKINPTIKEFLSDSYKFELEIAIIIEIENNPKDENHISIIFDKTIFHPQGGGQPSDEGELLNKNNKSFKVEVVTYDRERDIILHKIKKENFNSTDFSINQEFKQKINEEKRRLYAKLHSGGHLLDIAVVKLNLDLIPGKGYHFPDGPYVEYIGKIDKNMIQNLIEQFQNICNDTIESSDEEDKTISKFYDYEDGKLEFKELPSYLPDGHPFRWVKLQKFDIGCPCGGTHVKHLKDIGKLKINKISNKGKCVRISYNIV